jgi:ABC-type dipeptide/oligopeptide/nickel transport system permease component
MPLGLDTPSTIGMVIFVLGHVVGDPALVMAPVDASDQEIARIRQQLGLDRSAALFRVPLGHDSLPLPIM